jgi:hypothetical protein
MRDGEWNKERGARPSCVHDCMAPSLTTHSLPHAVTQLFEVTCVVGPDLWVTRRGLGDFEVLMSEVRLVCPNSFVYNCACGIDHVDFDVR